jgi:hypothetical protein
MKVVLKYPGKAAVTVAAGLTPAQADARIARIADLLGLPEDDGIVPLPDGGGYALADESVRSNPSRKIRLPEADLYADMEWKKTMTVAEYERIYGVDLGGELRESVVGPAVIAALIKSIGTGRTEKLIVLTLDGRHAPINAYVLTEGTVNSTTIHPREVFATAIDDRAVAIAIAHNHPAGDIHASPPDIQAMKRMKQAGDILGIRLLDCLIVTRQGWRSFMEMI